MKRSTSTLLVTISLAAAPCANADVSYSYLQGAWTGTEASTALGDQDGMGPEVSASYELLRFLHVFGGYRLIELDDISVETELFTAGAGVNYDFSDHQSVFFNLAGVEAQADLVTGVGSIGVDDTGYFYSIHKNTLLSGIHNELWTACGRTVIEVSPDLPTDSK